MFATGILLICGGCGPIHSYWGVESDNYYDGVGYGDGGPHHHHKPKKHKKKHHHHHDDDMDIQNVVDFYDVPT